MTQRTDESNHSKKGTVKIMGLVSKASATHSDGEPDYVLASDGEHDSVNDDGGNSDDRS